MVSFPSTNINNQQPTTFRKKNAVSNLAVIPAAFNSRMAGQAGTNLDRLRSPYPLHLELSPKG
jgi:hypothetical protein